MVESVTATSTSSMSLLPPAIVAAGIAAIVSLAIYWATARGVERSRRRELLAEAYQACIAYAEFPYRIRRRRASVEEDSGRLIAELNAVQERLAFFEAWTSLEGKRVRSSFRELLSGLRSVAGTEISRAWKTIPLEKDGEVDIKDVDLSALQPLQDRFLETVRGRVGTVMDRIRSIARR